jgi:hypothetical protein
MPTIKDFGQRGSVNDKAAYDDWSSSGMLPFFFDLHRADL